MSFLRSGDRYWYVLSASREAMPELSKSGGGLNWTWNRFPSRRSIWLRYASSHRSVNPLNRWNVIILAVGLYIKSI